MLTNTLRRLALASGILAALLGGTPAAFAHAGHHKVATTSAITATPGYIPYLGGAGDPLGLTSSTPVKLASIEANAGRVAVPSAYLPYQGGYGDPLGLTSPR